MNNEDANKDIYTPKDRNVWDTKCMAIAITGERWRERGDVWWFDMLAICGQLASAFQSDTVLV